MSERQIAMSARDAQFLSQMLFAAREHLLMWGEVVEGQTGKQDESVVSVITQIEGFRDRQGWSPFGGEPAVNP